MRTQFAYNFSLITNSSHPHLDSTHFKDTDDLNDAIKICSKALKSGHYITKLKNKYSNDLPPIWASVEIMTYHFDSWLHHLSLVRNSCAHHEYIWSMYIPMKATGVKNISNPSNRIYDSILLIKYLLEDIIQDDSKWHDRVIKLIGTNKVFFEPNKYMGFS